jgi:hypothetical protein
MATIPISAMLAGQSVFSPAVTLTSVANQIAWPLDTAQNATVTLTENTTLMNPTGMSGKIGKKCRLDIIQGAGAAYTLAYDTAYTNGGTLPLVSTALGANDYAEFRCTGTKMQQVLYSQNVGS